MKVDEFLVSLADEPGWSNVGTIELTTRDVHGDTPLHAALWAGDDEAARGLVDAGADVTAAGEEGYTPLHVAVAQGNGPMVTCLLAHGASWDTPSMFGSSPLESASCSDDPTIRALAAQVRK